MVDYGVTPQGFNKKPLTAILQSIGDRQRAVFGALFDTGTSTAAGQFNGTAASEIAECWELLEEAYHGTDPDAAAGYLLTALAGLTGTARRPAAGSVSRRQKLNLNPGATVNAGSLIEHSSRPDIRFATDVSVTNDGGAPADFEITATCTQTGPIGALAGSLTVIVNPVSGWNSTTNVIDAAVGRDVDSDITLRQRREAQLALRGGSTVAAIRADLLDSEAVPALVDMRSVKVLENTTDSVVDGMPPHSFEALIDDGDTPTIPNDTIAQVIWDSRPAGIRATGSASGEALDENGDTQIVPFSRVTLRPVYILITVTHTSDYPIDGDDLVKAALVAEGGTYEIAELVIALQLRAEALTVAGVTDVPVFTLGFDPAPVGTSNLDPGARARATFDSTNITVTS